MVKLKVKDGRGAYNKNIAKQNRQSIIDFFALNPDSSITDCSKELGLSWLTVQKHINAINQEDV